MKVEMNVGIVVALKVPDFEAAKINLSEYTGDFYSGELSTTYTMVIESGRLIARHFRTGDVLLTLTGPDNFTGNEWYFGKVVFTRESNGKISGFKVSGGRARNLKFEKIRNVNT
jgi:hypothetical protein